MKICIILNGEIKNYNYINGILSSIRYDYIICSDGGANHAYNMNIVPDYIIGELDSVNDDIIDYYIICNTINSVHQHTFFNNMCNNKYNKLHIKHLSSCLWRIHRSGNN